MDHPEKPDRDPDFFSVRIRRKPLYEWLLWIVWGFTLFLLAEYALASRREFEWQAATLATALFVIVLLGGLITGLIKRIEAQDQDKYH